MADKILKGNIDLPALKSVYFKKIFSNMQGKNTTEITIERLILRKIRNLKKEKMLHINPQTDEKIIFKFKKEPEKNKTHWDHLIEEMKWLQGDFEKERKIKKKNALDFIKNIKKRFNNLHIERQKQDKREKQELIKKSNIISRQVGVYWKKIEKITKYEYNLQLKEEQEVIKSNRLLNFINRLQKISSKVANSLVGDDPTSSQALLTLSSFNSTAVLDNSDNQNEAQVENDLANVANNAQQFQPKGFDLAHCNITLQQPFLIKFPLREYQLIGLNWLSALHDNKINGILADEMGLGKTIQTISMIAHLACNRGIWGPHLIIVPTTIIINWEIEFKKWCPSLKILSYYGNQKERKAKRAGWQKENSFNVCIASYKLVIQDFANFKRKKWYYVVLDEAQNIKNFKSKRWQMILNLKAKRKLLLSGTPLQNDIMEIWSYLHFLMPNLFYSNEEFRDWFHSQFQNAVNKNSALNKKLINSLHSILRPFILRRLKKDVEKQLPEKKEHIIKCDLTRRQKYIYDEYINTDKTQETLCKNDYFSIMNVLMQLRKVCNHPDLFEARDYITPTKQIFLVDYLIPHLIVDLFEYNPMKTINYKSLNLILEANEKLSMLDYLSLLKNFPQNSIPQIYDKVNNDSISLSNPYFAIKDNDIMFKRQYNDSTIFYNSNTQNCFNLSVNFKGEENLFSGDLSKYYVPHYLCPTNIPLLKDNSLLNFFDIFHPNENECYVESFFEENIKINKNKKFKYKKNLFATFDRISRQYILYSKPVYGSSLNKNFKISLACENVFATKNIVYGEFKYNQNKHNLVNSQVLNKFASYDRTIDNFNNYSYEDIYDYSSNTIKNEMQVEDENNNQAGIPYIKALSNKKFTQLKTNPVNSICFINSDALSNMILTPQKLLAKTEDLINYFHLFVPRVITGGPRLFCSSFKTSKYYVDKKYQRLYNNLNKIPNVQRYFSILKTISFPDRRLIEYDSGKLIKLAGLLKNLRYNKSKCLIFTQMTKMLDILETFLNIHGYAYVRLDGTTKVEVRQAIVDRFNNDNKIFCFISSTRSGGIGLNLTGADSIIFYDTDWNPAMDKQAQDRCHRIGQTRTVNIYRLITSKTIEENIFKKSIQKRELSHIVMEGGQFDIEQLKENKIDFKNVVLEEGLIKREYTRTSMMAFENIKFENEEEQKNIESLLIRIEDKEDVQAYKYASMEMLNAYEQENNEQKFLKMEDDDKNNFERLIYDKLRPIDKFAIKYYKTHFSYNDFTLEKEANSKQQIMHSEGSDIDDIEDDNISNDSEEEKKATKVDMEEAYKLYLTKKEEIMRSMEENN